MYQFVCSHCLDQVSNLKSLLTIDAISSVLMSDTDQVIEDEPMLPFSVWFVLQFGYSFILSVRSDCVVALACFHLPGPTFFSVSNIEKLGGSWDEANMYMSISST